MSIYLSRKEEELLASRITEEQKKHHGELSHRELSLLTFRLRNEIIKDREIIAASRASKRALKRESHNGALQWSQSRPPRPSFTR